MSGVVTSSIGVLPSALVSVSLIIGCESSSEAASTRLLDTARCSGVLPVSVVGMLGSMPDCFAT